MCPVDSPPGNHVARVVDKGQGHHNNSLNSTPLLASMQYHEGGACNARWHPRSQLLTRLTGLLQHYLPRLKKQRIVGEGEYVLGHCSTAVKLDSPGIIRWRMLTLPLDFSPTFLRGTRKTMWVWDSMGIGESGIRHLSDWQPSSLWTIQCVRPFHKRHRLLTWRTQRFEAMHTDALVFAV